MEPWLLSPGRMVLAAGAGGRRTLTVFVYHF